MPFSDYFTRKVPTTLQRATWARYLGALGAQLDGSADGDYPGRGTAAFDWGLVARTKAAVKARFPLLAPSDGLEQIGVERKMPRGPGESSASYGTRLQGAWNTWPWAGTAFGVLSALSAGGYPKAEVRIQKSRRYYLDATGALVDETRPANEWWIDSLRTFWSRFVVLLYPPFPFGGAVPADGSPEQQRIARLVKQWKSSHSTCTDIFVIESGRTWGSYPNGATWGAQGRATWGDDLAVLTRWSP